MRATEAYRWLNIAAGTLQLPDADHTTSSGPIPLQGGTYQIVINCTGTPAMEFDQLGPDGSTWNKMYVQPDSAPGTPTQSMATSGAYWKVTVPPGLYRLVVGTSTANYVSLTRIPTSE